MQNGFVALTVFVLSFGFFMQVRPVLPQGASGGIQGVWCWYLGRKESVKGRGTCRSVRCRPEVYIYISDTLLVGRFGASGSNIQEQVASKTIA